MPGSSISAATRPEQTVLDYHVLFVAEWPEVLRYLRRAVRDQDLAEDLAQETFLRAAQGLATFRRESSPRTWLRRIAANVLRDHWRTRPSQGATAVRSLSPEDDLRLADPQESPALAVERQGVRKCLAELVAQLPPGEQEALILAVQHGMPPREIARSLRVAPEAARARVHRARRRLAAMVADRCVLEADEGGALSCETRAPYPAIPVRRSNPVSAA